MTSSLKTPKRAPKKSQMERTKNSVLSATIELLGEMTFGRLTVDLISERSGVSRSTIYRYWKTVPELVSDAFDSAIGPEPALVDEGSLREQLIKLYAQAPDNLTKSTWGRVLPSLVAASNSEGEFSGRLKKISDRRRIIIRKHIQTWIDRGDLKKDTDPDRMIDTMSGVFYYRRLVTGKSLHEPKLGEWVIDAVLEASYSDTYKKKLRSAKKPSG